MIKRWASLALKILLTAAAVWYLQQKVDLRAAWEVCKTISPWWLGAAIGLLGVQVFVCGGRWKLVLWALRSHLPFFQAVELFVIGNFFGQVLPGAVGGDAVRIWKTHQAGLSLKTSVNSVLLERVVTVFGLVVLVAATQPLLLDRLSATTGAWVFPALTVAGLIGMVVLTLLDRLPAALTHLRIVRGFMALAADSRLLFLKPKHALPTLILTVFGHVNLALVVWALGRGIGAPVTALDCIVLVPPVVLVATLPISIAGWGVRENMMVLMFSSIGVAHEQSAAMSLLFGVASVVISLPGGLFWLRDKGDLTKEKMEELEGMESGEA